MQIIAQQLLDSQHQLENEAAARAIAVHDEAERTRHQQQTRQHTNGSNSIRPQRPSHRRHNPSAQEINVASIHIRNERLQHQRNAERANYRAAIIAQRRGLLE